MNTAMNTARGRSSRPAWALLGLLAALGCSSALAAGKATPLDPKLRYQRESAACSPVRLSDERANCLSEASTRYASTRALPEEERADALARNALKRCEPLPEAERKDCMARIQGQGTVSGSVQAGGIYRELVTREVVTEPTR